jgi:Spy/CpxP family protein refolding chaperone
MHRTWGTFIPALLFIGTLSSAFALPDSASMQAPDRDRVMMAQHLAKELGLTKDQQIKMRNIHLGMETLRKDNRDKIKAVLDESKAELLKEAPSRVVLYRLARDMGNLRREMAEKEADNLLKLKTILTDEQFKKLLSMPPHMPYRMPDNMQRDFHPDHHHGD